jgi:hypothetical protein
MKKPDSLLLTIGIFTASLPTLHLFHSVTYLFIATLGAGLIAIALSFLARGRRPSRFAGIALCGAAIIGSYSLITYGNRSGKPIRVVLPKGFTGEFSIVRDSEAGAPPNEVGDAWIYRIPPSGVLKTSNDRPFFIWHSITFENTEGTPVSVESLGTTAGNRGSKASTDYEGTTHNWRTETRGR